MQATIFREQRSALSLFQDDQPWLARQPHMASWEDGCQRLLAQLQQWLSEYTEALGMAPVTPEHPQAFAYLQRLWKCWSYHWQMAARMAPSGSVDGAAVAERIRAGRGWLGNGRLGGDVLRDVVLAEALLQHDTAALAAFEKEYRGYAIRMAATVRASLASCPDWWNDLLDHLAGFSYQGGKLACYQGRSGLQSWLGTTVRFFLWDQVRREPSRREEDGYQHHLETCRQAPAPEDDLIADECLQMFRGHLHAAFARLTARERTLLFLLFAERMSGKEVAAVLHVHPGNITRSKDKVLARLQTVLLDEESGPSGKTVTYRECLRDLLAGPARLSFAQALTEALRSSVQQEMPA